MIFTLTTSGYFYSEKRANELRALGFEFLKSEGLSPDDEDRMVMGDKHPEIEIKTLDELVAFAEKWGQVVFDGGTIEIYDNYRE